jgi:ATP-binding cassette subfamily B protein
MLPIVIALARALAMKPSVLLLDEATSALDGVTESKILENLSALHVTRVIVAHRLSTTWRADKIFVMVEGGIVESGTHEELMQRGGQYVELITAQQATTAR